jgi:hypothetical protein
MSGYPSHCSNLQGTARPDFLFRPVSLYHCQSGCGSYPASCSVRALSPGVKAAESWNWRHITIWECRDEEYLAFTSTLSIHHAWGLDKAATSLLPFFLSFRVLCYVVGTPVYWQTFKVNRQSVVHSLCNRIWVSMEVFVATAVSSESLNRWTSKGVFLITDMHWYVPNPCT